MSKVRVGEKALEGMLMNQSMTRQAAFVSCLLLERQDILVMKGSLGLPARILVLVLLACSGAFSELLRLPYFNFLTVSVIISLPTLYV